MNVTPLPPELDDAPVMVFGHCFLDQEEWQRFTKLGSHARRHRLGVAWWRVELYLAATHQNVPCN